MPGYLSGLHVSKGIVDPEKNNSLPYGDIKKEASREHFFKITGYDNQSHATYHFDRDAEDFIEQIPYYQVKLGYNLVINLLNFIGFSGHISIYW